MITLPEAFEQEMKQLLGEEEYEAYRKTFDEAVHRGLRVNNGKISTEEFLRRTDIPLKKVPWIPNGFYYDEESCNPAKDADYYAGLYYLQEPSAMTPASRLPIEPDDRVLDLCAARAERQRSWEAGSVRAACCWQTISAIRGRRRCCATWKSREWDVFS